MAAYYTYIRTFVCIGVQPEPRSHHKDGEKQKPQQNLGMRMSHGLLSHSMAVCCVLVLWQYEIVYHVNVRL